MFWLLILIAFGVIFLLSWLGGAMVNRGMKIGPSDANAFIPGLHHPHDDDLGGH